MNQGSFSSSLFHAENWGGNLIRRGEESYQSLPVALQCENPNFSLNASFSRGAHQPPQQISVIPNQNSDWYESVQNQNGFLVATSSIPISGENRQSRFVSRVPDQNQVLQQEGIYLAYPSRGQPGQNQLEIRNQTAAYPNNPLVRQSRTPSRGAQAHQNMSFGVQEQGEFVEYRVLPRGTPAQDSMNFEVGQGGPGESGAPSAQERVYSYGDTTESFMPIHFSANGQQQVQYQAFALPQPSQYGYVPQQWPNQQTAQVAQMEREMELELQNVKLSGQCARLLKELPSLNGTEGREAIIDFFTALETRTTEWSSEKIIEVLAIKVKGKARKEMAAVVSRVGNTISLEILRTEVIKALYGDESLEKRSPQDSGVESIDHHRSSATIEENVVGDNVEGQNFQILQKSRHQKNFLGDLSNGTFGREIDASQLPLKISFTTQEISKFLKGERMKGSPISPLQMFFPKNLTPNTHMLNISSCSAGLNGDSAVSKRWSMEVHSAAKNAENGGCKGSRVDQQPQGERKRSEKEETSPKRATEEKIEALEKQLVLVSKERDKLKTLVESFIGGKETNRKARKRLAHKFRQVYPGEKTEKKSVATGKGELAKSSTHASKPNMREKTPGIQETPPTCGLSPCPDSVKCQQKKSAEGTVLPKSGQNVRRTGIGRVFVNSALKKTQATPNADQTFLNHKNSGFSNKNIRKQEKFFPTPANLHRGVRVFVNSRYKNRSGPGGPPSSDPDTRAASQNSGRLNKATPCHSTSIQPNEARAKGTQPSPQSFFQGLPTSGSTGLLQQVDEDATSEGAGEDGPTAAEGSGFLEAGDVGLCWPFPYLNM